MDSGIQIFICYGQQDKAEVEELYSRLSWEGIKPWMEGKDIALGGDWESDVQKAIRESDFFLLCLSKDVVDERGNLRKDIQSLLRFLWKGSSKGTYLIPARLEDCKVPEDLKGFEVVDLFAEDGWHELLREIDVVKKRRAQLEEAFPELQELPGMSPNLTFDVSKAHSEESEVDFLLEGPEDTSSVFEWSIELRRLINGEREDALIRLGSVEEYIEVLLSESEDQPLAEAAFQEALRSLVQTWEPTLIEPDNSIALMLELIGLYTPLEGVIKIVALVQRLRSFSHESVIVKSQDESFDLHLKSLVVLENYYDSAPPPPLDESPAYRTYVDLLKEDLLTPLYSGYVAGRLVDLRVIQLGNDDLDYVIERYPEAVRGLVTVLADKNRRSIAERDLSYVYTHCLKGGDELEHAFEGAIVSSGGQIILEEGGPLIRLQGDEIRLKLPQDSRDDYFELTLRRQEEGGFDKFRSLASMVD